MWAESVSPRIPFGFLHGYICPCHLQALSRHSGEAGEGGMRLHNLLDAWIDWRDGTLSFRDCLFMLGIFKGEPVKLAPPPPRRPRWTVTTHGPETMVCGAWCWQERKEGEDGEV